LSVFVEVEVVAALVSIECQRLEKHTEDLLQGQGVKIPF
jgi:hypothetical protein